MGGMEPGAEVQQARHANPNNRSISRATLMVASARTMLVGQCEELLGAHALGADPDGAAHLRVPHWLPGACVERVGMA